MVQDGITDTVWSTYTQKCRFNSQFPGKPGVSGTVHSKIFNFIWC